jgi:tRNA(adenine34) deaminase
MMYDEEMMLRALEIAEGAEGEVPVGAVVVTERGETVGTGANTVETTGNPLGHAEINAIIEAAERMKSVRLTGCTIYITLEPCAMCAGAIINARLKRVVFGAYNPTYGAGWSVTQMFGKFPHKVMCRGGVLEERCGVLMRKFFGELRGDT